MHPAAISTSTSAMLLSLPGEVPMTPPCGTVPASPCHSPLILIMPDLSGVSGSPCANGKAEAEGKDEQEHDETHAKTTVDEHLEEVSKEGERLAVTPAASEMTVDLNQSDDAPSALVNTTSEAAAAADTASLEPPSRMTAAVVQFICDAMAESEYGALTLDVIYKKIRKNWPEYKTSPGWQIKVRKLLNGKGFLKERQSQASIPALVAEAGRYPRGSLYMRNHQVPYAYLLTHLDHIENVYASSMGGATGNATGSSMVDSGSVSDYASSRASSEEPTIGYKSLSLLQRQQQRKRKLRRTASLVDVSQSPLFMQHQQQHPLQHQAYPPLSGSSAAAINPTGDMPRFVQLPPSQQQQSFFVGHLAHHQRQQKQQQEQQQQQPSSHRASTAGTTAAGASMLDKKGALPSNIMSGMDAAQMRHFSRASSEPPQLETASGLRNTVMPSSSLDNTSAAPLLPHAMPFIAPMSTMEMSAQSFQHGKPGLPPSLMYQQQQMQQQAVLPDFKGMDFMQLMTCNPFLAWSLTCGAYAPLSSSTTTTEGHTSHIRGDCASAGGIGKGVSAIKNMTQLPQRAASMPPPTTSALVDIVTVKPEMVFASRSRDESFRSRTSTQSWQTIEEEQANVFPSSSITSTSTAEPMDASYGGMVRSDSHSSLTSLDALTMDTALCFADKKRKLLHSPIDTSLAPWQNRGQLSPQRAQLSRSRAITDELFCSTAMTQDGSMVDTYSACASAIAEDGHFTTSFRHAYHADHSAPSVWEENHLTELQKWRDVSQALAV